MEKTCDFFVVDWFCGKPIGHKDAHESADTTNYQDGYRAGQLAMRERAQQKLQELVAFYDTLAKSDVDEGIQHGMQECLDVVRALEPEEPK